MPYLREFLGRHNASQPASFGRRFHFLGNKEQDATYYSGGAGIILSRETLRQLGQKAEKDSAVWAGPSSGPEDQLLAKTLMVNFGLYPIDTRDANGRHVFITLGLDPERIFTRKDQPDLWFWQFSQDAKEGPACCSPKWITTHYIKAAQVSEGSRSCDGGLFQWRVCCFQDCTHYAARCPLLDSLHVDVRH